MSIIKTPYEIGIRFEQAGHYQVAYSFFKDCMTNQQYDLGDLYFHCGWCAENLKLVERHTAIENYLLAGKLSSVNSTKANSYFRAGWIFMHLDQNENAINCFLNSIEFAKHNESIAELYSDALYWCAVCFEREKRFIKAIGQYRIVKEISNRLNPECRYRELMCLMAISSYSEAFKICDSFDNPRPEEFSFRRYQELRRLVNKEKTLLEVCLKDGSPGSYYASC